MSKTLKLTWQPGRDGRAGRWRKKYQGKVYYFSGGRGKSDREAYENAVRQWELEKLKADAAAPRKYQAEYEDEIDLWDQVRTWAQRHGDMAMAQLAFEKRELLRSRLAAPILKPISADVRFKTLFQPVTISLPEDLIDRAAKSIANGELKSLGSPEIPAEMIRHDLRELDGSQHRIQKEIWDDRLASQKRRSVVGSHLVEAHVTTFIDQKLQEASRGDLSMGRYNVIRVHLEHFRKWIGRDADVTEIDGCALRNYHAQLLDMVKHRSSKKGARTEEDVDFPFSTTTAKEYLTTVKSFVRWLWEIEVITALPRILANSTKSLKISAEYSAPVILDDTEVQLLLRNATGRTRLFVLLMLNCGMTQKDIADLLKREVDLKTGRIVRKRSKTVSFTSVPTVNYLLWPETVKLLQEYFNQGDSERAILNSNGSVLWSEQLNAEGRYSKTDNIKNAYFRLARKLGLTKPLKSLKKTSSSKLRDNERFNGVEDLFLGHAPQKMSDKHYTTAPQKLLDAAICWLATEYGLEAPQIG